MIYSLTEKLNFEDNPVIKIKDKKIEVKADAETVLSLLDVLQAEGEMQASIEAAKLLFSEKDQKTIKSLKLKFDDYLTLITTAISLALGEDPDEEDKQGEE